MNFKTLFFIFLITINLYAENDKLKIYSKIALKTLFYDFDFKRKLYANRVIFGVVYSDINRRKAIDLKKYLTLNAESLNNLTLEVKLINEDELDELNNLTCIYIFNVSDEKLKIILDYATNHQILTFTSSRQNIKKGVNILFDLHKEIEVIVNKESIQKSNIKFKSTFLKAVRIYDDK